jgi:cAMP-binding proteins - catabolite gene activator and regulatory subunit of cAMP-dependent protein kinases
MGEGIVMEKGDQKTLPGCLNCKNGLLCTATIPLFSTLPKDIQKNLTEHSVQTTKAKGSFLFRAGEKVDSVLIIRKGRIKLCKYDADGNEYILDIIHDGDAVWENLFLENAVFPYSAVCLSKVELCEIRKSEFIQLLADRPGIAMNLISLLSLRLKDANEKALLLSIRDPKVRLAGFLLDRDIRCVGPEIKLKLEDIAASIGLRPETVSRNLSRFEKEGLIQRLGQGKILVTDRSGLKKIYETSQSVK